MNTDRGPLDCEKTASVHLSNKRCDELNLASSADSAEDPTDAVSEMTYSIFEDDIPFPPRASGFCVLLGTAKFG